MKRRVFSLQFTVPLGQLLAEYGIIGRGEGHVTKVTCAL